MPKPTSRKKIGAALRRGGDQPAGGKALQLDHIERAGGFRDREVKIDQADQQDEAAEPEIDGDLPGGGAARRCPRCR